MAVIYLDNHLLVLEKGAGMLVQPDLQEWGKAFLKEKFAKPGAVFLEPIHRLDRPVSGLVLFARTSKALSRLNESMREREIKKTYLAKVEGIVPTKEGTLENYLMHGEFQAEVVDKNHPQAKLAILHYRVIKVEEGTTWLEIDLETGRYHQIRAQFSHFGYPIRGDKKYGSRIDEASLSLHHARLELTHPVTQERLQFTASVPKDF